MIDFPVFNLLFTIWFNSFIYFDFEVFMPSLGIKKRLNFSLKYPSITIREKYWKIWNEGAKMITEDDSFPF